MATTASPLSFALWPPRRISTAQTMVTARIRGMSWVRFSTAATAMAPKATWERPSPMRENLRSTRGTPSREAHRAMRTPAMRA